MNHSNNTLVIIMTTKLPEIITSFILLSFAISFVMASFLPGIIKIRILPFSNYILNHGWSILLFYVSGCFGGCSNFMLLIRFKRCREK